MNAKELITFKNEQLGEIRGFVKDGEIWFLAAQVCRCLGIKNSRQAIENLKQRMKVVEDWNKNRGVISNDSPKSKNITLVNGKSHTQVTIIPEEWLYELIFASRKQTAIVFRAWVTHEVLPALRKYGEYRMSTKMFTKDLNETIKNQVVDNSTNENEKRFAYSNFHKLINKSLGLPPKNDRDIMSNEELEQVARRENLVNALLLEGKNYSEIKTIVSNF